VTELPQLVRRGSCNRCGQCCFPDPSEGGHPLFTAAELADPDRISGACPMLRVDGGRYRCAGCDGHPHQPEDVRATPTCSYTFEAA
jgi:hypothetical protein